MTVLVHIVTFSALFMLLVPRKRPWILAAVAVALIAVFTKTPLELQFWSAVGMPSIISLSLLCDLALRRQGMPLLADRGVLLAMEAAAFVILEPAALGFLPLDLYRLGFSPLAPLAIAIVAAIVFRPRVALVILAALIAFDFHLLGSTNLWDYLVDPIGGVVAVAVVVRRSLTAPASALPLASESFGHLRDR